MTDAANRRLGTVERLVVYPIKGCGGVRVDAADIALHGLAWDRRWMLVEEDGSFVSQRTTARLALVRVSVSGDALRVRAPGMPVLEMPVAIEGHERVPVELWGDVCDALPADATAERWFSAFLDRPVRPVYLPDDALRRAGPADADVDVRVGFADAAPILLTSTSSLGDLNRRAQTDLPMDRFRPNIVVDGFGAFAEDGWQRIRIGGSPFIVAKACARCAVTTIDQETSVAGAEPLKTLATFRKVRNSVMFGQYLAHLGPGSVRVGDPVEVLA